MVGREWGGRTSREPAHWPSKWRRTWKDVKDVRICGYGGNLIMDIAPYVGK